MYFEKKSSRKSYDRKLNCFKSSLDLWYNLIQESCGGSTCRAVFSSIVKIALKSNPSAYDYVTAFQTAVFTETWWFAYLCSSRIEGLLFPGDAVLNDLLSDQLEPLLNLLQLSSHLLRKQSRLLSLKEDESCQWGNSNPMHSTVHTQYSMWKWF